MTLLTDKESYFILFSEKLRKKQEYRLVSNFQDCRSGGGSPPIFFYLEGVCACLFLNNKLVY